MNLRIEGDPLAIAGFLFDNEYPAPWTSASLRDYAISLRLETEAGDTAGYIWGTWKAALPGALDFHVCMAPAHRGAWLTQDVWSQLTYVAKLLGAESLVTTTIGDREARLVAALLQRRFHFVQLEDGSLFLPLEDTHGLSLPKHS